MSTPLSAGPPLANEARLEARVAELEKEVARLKAEDPIVDLLRVLMHHAPVGFALLDPEMRYRVVNEFLAEMNGVPAEEHMGLLVEDVVPSIAAAARNAFLEVVETGKTIQHEFTGETVKAPGVTRTWAETWYPVNGPEGRRVGVGVVISDITDLKHAEERYRRADKLESIGILAGGVAHDFNNLLVGVIGNVSLAQNLLPQGHPAADRLKQVLRIGEQAAQLTRQMLAYAGKGHVVVDAVDLSALIEELQTLIEPALSRRISFRVQRAKTPTLIQADSGQIQQVFMNLILNAAEAIGNDPGLITVRTGIRELADQDTHQELEGAELTPGKYVYLEVSDTGCGMEETVKPKIFEPFFSTKFTGRGLGLAAVGGIVRSHRGGIKVSSKPGQGSTLTVLFPAIEQA